MASKIIANIRRNLENGADERVSNWLLMSTFWPNIAIIAVYLLLVYKILPEFMQNRKPFNLTRVIRVYNLGQVATCLFLIYWTATSGWVQGDYTLGCQLMDYSSKDPKALSLLQALHWAYFLKLTELIETIFFVLRKKFSQVSALHVYHHTSTLIVAWTSCKYIGGPMPSVHLMMNCFIHVLMYTYYYLSSKGPVWQKRINPWKPWITRAQMIQFTLLLLHLVPPLLPYCKVNKAYAIFTVFYMPNIIFLYYMFYDFYKKAYRREIVLKKIK
ncbi:unnamed protein product [Ceutorhynchus assimilis]|uniref:Elongation of very long chain fatty acids protein n=1 Tax=Ceutorhynchus assimilis TaxID=467358 RepID=A0A9N9MKJ7_9CUCU|nr:unnamed protein product [Ceutorhynchus assimilis]